MRSSDRRALYPSIGFLYPEGIRGAFKRYKEAYELGLFVRPDYAKFAIEHGVPIVPFVVVGHVEIFPILAKLKWKWVKKHVEWPCLPVTPTFPFLPIPLPSKWHVQFLPPIDPAPAIEEGKQSGRPAYQILVKQVREAIEKAQSEILEKRPSIFYGNVFGEGE